MYNTYMYSMQPYSRYMYIEATIVLETDYLSIPALYMYNVVVHTYTVYYCTYALLYLTWQ